MIPLGDERAPVGAPVASRTLLVAFCAAFLWQLSAGPLQASGEAFGFAPALFFGKQLQPPGAGWVPPSATLVTYMFVHAGWLHLLGNALYLWIFGDDVEEAFGQVRFVVFYLACGMAAALAQGWPAMHDARPMVGASGAVSGVLGAYLVLYPRAQINVLMPVFVFWDVVRLPAFLVLGFWFVVQLLYETAGPAISGGIAFRAHLGGFIAGAALAPFLRRRAAGPGPLLR